MDFPSKWSSSLSAFMVQFRARPRCHDVCLDSEHGRHPIPLSSRLSPVLSSQAYSQTGRAKETDKTRKALRVPQVPGLPGY